MAQQANLDVAAYETRRGRVGAAAEAVRFAAQAVNDFSLKFAIDREVKRHTATIAEALVRGGGALVVLNVDATSPPGNVGMVVARSISSSYVVAHPNSDGRQAVMFWEDQPKLENPRPAHTRREVYLLWIRAPEVP
jgi:hypothetical protein